MPVICTDSVSYTYPHRQSAAVKSLSFLAEAGEYIAVLGINGSGKSTLARLLCGFLEPDTGCVTLQDGIRTGIVFQSPDDQIVAGIVERDTAFGPRNLKLAEDIIRQRTDECLSATGLDGIRNRPTATLSPGQKQKLAFAGITALHPDILVLDEVTAMIDPESREKLLDLLDEQHRNGTTIIHITHDTGEAARAQRILAMEDGVLIFDGNRETFTTDTALYTRLFGEPEPGGQESRSAAKPALSGTGGETQPALLFDNITFAYQSGSNTPPLFRDFSLSIPAGSLAALTGASGSGKSTLLELGAGLLKPVQGCIRCTDRPVLALQDSDHALFEEFAADDVAYGLRNRGIAGTELAERVKIAMETVGLPFREFADRRTLGLSGGEKRKLSLAGILALDAPVLLFDEPTAGLDPVSRRNMLSLLRKLTAAGKTVVFSTHRQEEAAAADIEIHLDGNIPVAAAGSRTPHTTGKQTETPGSTKIPEHGTPSGFSGNASGSTTGTDCPAHTQAEKIPVLPEQPPLSGIQLITFLHNCGIPAAGEQTSPVHRLPAAVKYLLFLVLFIGAFTVRTVPLSAGAFALTLVYAVCARYPVRRLLRSFAVILPWMLLFFIFQMFFLPVSPDETPLWTAGFLTVTPGKLTAGILTVLHLAGAFTAAAVFTYSITEQEVLDGLETLLKPLGRCGIPVRHVTLTAGIVFRFIPLLAEEAALIIKVQLIRGGLGSAKSAAARILIMIPLIVPLFLRALKRAGILADALTARYYS